jgi:hypothetical protein
MALVPPSPTKNREVSNRKVAADELNFGEPGGR